MLKCNITLAYDFKSEYITGTLTGLLNFIFRINMSMLYLNVFKFLIVSEIFDISLTILMID